MRCLPSLTKSIDRLVWISRIVFSGIVGGIEIDAEEEGRHAAIVYVSCCRSFYRFLRMSAEI